MQQLFHAGELRMQRRIHRRALGLVLRQHLHTHAWLALVKGADHAVGMEGLDHLDEHRDKAEYRIGRRAVGSGHRRGDRMESAMHQRIAIDDGDGAARRVS